MICIYMIKNIRWKTEITKTKKKLNRNNKNKKTVMKAENNTLIQNINKCYIHI